MTLLGGRPEAPQLARALLAAGARIAPAEGSGSVLTPMHMAMYYGAGPGGCCGRGCAGQAGAGCWLGLGAPLAGRC